MNDFIVLAASAVVVAVLAGVAALLGFRQAARIDEAELQTLLAAADPDARIAEAVIGADGRAGFALLRDGKILVAKALGDRVSLRIAPSNGVSLRLDAASLRVTFADLGFPGLHIKLNTDPPRWLQDLAAGAGEEA